MRVHHDPRPPKNRRSLKERWQYLRTWFGELPRAGRVTVIVLLLIAVGGIVGAALPDRQSASERFIHEHRAEWIDECGDYATSWVDGTVYVIGGREWMHQLNRCLQEKANDQTP